MFFFRKSDEAELAKLLKAEADDRKELERLEREFDALRPKWDELQTQAETVAAHYACSDRTYSREISESLWRARDPSTKARLDEIIRQRDALTVPLEQKIRNVKSRIRRRRTLVTGGFGSWVSGELSSRLPAAMAAEIEQTRRELEKSEDLAATFRTIERWVTRLADFDQGPASIPLLNLAALVRRASTASASGEVKASSEVLGTGSVIQP